MLSTVPRDACQMNIVLIGLLMVNPALASKCTTHSCGPSETSSALFFHILNAWSSLLGIAWSKSDLICYCPSKHFSHTQQFCYNLLMDVADPGLIMAPTWTSFCPAPCDCSFAQAGDWSHTSVLIQTSSGEPYYLYTSVATCYRAS